NTFRHTAHPRIARARGAREPAVVVDATAGHNVEELSLSSARRLGVVKRVGHADAGDWILLESVHDARRGDLRQFVNRGSNVDHVMKLRAGGWIGLDTSGPSDCHWLTCAAEVGAHQFGSLVGGAACPAPSGVVPVVGLGATQYVKSTELVQRGDVLRDLGGNSVLRQLLADGSVQALRRRTVVAPDVEDQRVV